MRRLLVTVNVIPISPILAILMMETCSSETWVFTRVTWRNIPEDSILHSHRRENLNLTYIEEISYAIWERLLTVKFD
jgi:hypothetical protein